MQYKSAKRFFPANLQNTSNENSVKVNTVVGMIFSHQAME